MIGGVPFSVDEQTPEATARAERAVIAILRLYAEGEREFRDLEIPFLNLAGAELNGIDFERLQPRSRDFSGAKLTNSRFEGATLTRASLQKADFERADLARADLIGADFSDASFHGASLIEASLYSGNGARAFFVEADLSETCLGMLPSIVRMPPSDFRGAYFSTSKPPRRSGSRGTLPRRRLRGRGPHRRGGGRSTSTELHRHQDGVSLDAAVRVSAAAPSAYAVLGEPERSASPLGGPTGSSTGQRRRDGRRARRGERGSTEAHRGAAGGRRAAGQGAAPAVGACDRGVGGSARHTFWKQRVVACSASSETPTGPSAWPTPARSTIWNGRRDSNYPTPRNTGHRTPRRPRRLDTSG